MLMQLSENTILITGGATGIGLAMASAFIKLGNKVIICARSPEHLDNAAQKLPGLVCYRCDVSDKLQRQAMLAAMAGAGLQPNILINNAAIMATYPLAGISSEDLVSIKTDIAVNLLAPIELVAELMPVISKQPAPLIINMNSPAGIVAVAQVPIYSATKAALHSYTLSLRHHLKDSGVRVVEVFPPGVDTPMTANTARKQISAQSFVSQLLRALEKGGDEIWIGEARAVRWLARFSRRGLFQLINRQLPITKS